MFVKRFDVTYPLLTLVPELVSSLENVKIRMKHVLNVLMYIKSIYHAHDDAFGGND